MPPMPGSDVLRGWLDRQLGRQIPVFIERDTLARTPQFAEIIVSGQPTPAPIGATVGVRITGHDGRRLEAETLV